VQESGTKQQAGRNCAWKSSASVVGSMRIGCHDDVSVLSSLVKS
jgi:hypothetical protein